jgi:glycosyltransferase involved in cell wall biosynthesis
LPPCVEVLPFIGKDSAEKRRALADLYARSHFFIMPSRAEAFGIVFAEASAFGVPCLATRVGGLPSVIVDGINGRLFPLEAGALLYANYILQLMRDPERYRDLALRTAQEGAVRLSWKSCGRRIAEILYEMRHPPITPVTPGLIRSVATTKF